MEPVSGSKELMRLSSDKHLTWKTCSMLAVSSAKRFSEPHDF